MRNAIDGKTGPCLPADERDKLLYCLAAPWGDEPRLAAALKDAQSRGSSVEVVLYQYDEIPLIGSSFNGFGMMHLANQNQQRAAAAETRIRETLESLASEGGLTPALHIRYGRPTPGGIAQLALGLKCSRVVISFDCSGRFLPELQRSLLKASARHGRDAANTAVERASGSRLT